MISGSFSSSSIRPINCCVLGQVYMETVLEPGCGREGSRLTGFPCRYESVASKTNIDFPRIPQFPGIHAVESTPAGRQVEKTPPCQEQCVMTHGPSGRRFRRGTRSNGSGVSRDLTSPLRRLVGRPHGRGGPDARPNHRAHARGQPVKWNAASLGGSTPLDVTDRLFIIPGSHWSGPGRCRSRRRPGPAWPGWRSRRRPR